MKPFSIAGVQMRVNASYSNVDAMKLKLDILTHIYAKGEIARCVTTVRTAAAEALRFTGESVAIDYGAGPERRRSPSASQSASSRRSRHSIFH
jgi:hypothetical protein